MFTSRLSASFLCNPLYTLLGRRRRCASHTSTSLSVLITVIITILGTVTQEGLRYTLLRVLTLPEVGFTFHAGHAAYHASHLRNDERARVKHYITQSYTYTWLNKCIHGSFFSKLFSWKNQNFIWNHILSIVWPVPALGQKYINN